MRKYLAGLAVAGTVILAAGAAPVAVAHAAGSALTPTRISLSPASQSVTYASPTVTIQGTLKSVTLPAQALAGQQVSIELEVGYNIVPLTTVTTDVSGQFTLTIAVPAPGQIVATFSGNSTYGAAKGAAKVTAASPGLPARFVFGPVAPAVADSTDTVPGQLQMQTSGGSWVAAPYVPLYINQGEDVSVPLTTDASGNFSVTFRVGPEDPVQLEAMAAPGAAWSAPVNSQSLVVPLSVYPTLAGLGATASIEDLRNMSFFGYVTYEDTQGAHHPDAGATVDLCYEQTVEAPCFPRASATTNADGDVAFGHVSGYLPGGKLALSGGFWVLNVLGTSTDLSTSASAWVHVDVPVWIHGARVKHSGRRAFLTGVLDDSYRSGPVPGQRVTIYWDHGRRRAIVRTGGNGAFSLRLTGRPAGVYVVTYSGGGMTGGAFIPARPGEHVKVAYRP